MKRIAKRISALVLALFLLFNVGTVPARAAGATIALSASTVSIGQNVTATISISGEDIVAYTIYVTYSANVLEYTSGSGSAAVGGGGGALTLSGSGAGSVSLNFKAIANGNASISTSGSEIYDINENPLDFSHAGVTVTVATEDTQAPTTEAEKKTEDTSSESTEATTTEEDTKSDNCNLKSLQISPGVLSPAFSPATTSYFVQVEEDVTKMVVSAVTEDEKASTSVWGAGQIDPGENTVKITVTAENGAVRVYNIRVLAGEDKGAANVTLNGISYEFMSKPGNLEIPEGFSKSELEYEDWKVTAYESENGKIVIVPLKTVVNDEDVVAWFLYDKANKTFIPYVELSSQYVRYVILPVPEGVEVPEGFAPAELVLPVEQTGDEEEPQEQKLDAFKNDNIEDGDIYLLYAMNLEGKEDFYFFDLKEKTFLRYAIPVASPTEPEPEVIATPAEPTTAEPTVIVKYEKVPVKGMDRVTKILLIGGGSVVLLSMLFIIILLAMRAKKLQNELDNADDMINHLADGKKGVDSVWDVVEEPKKKVDPVPAPEEDSVFAPEEPVEDEIVNEDVEAEEKDNKKHGKDKEKKSKKHGKDKNKEEQAPVRDQREKSEIERINEIELPDVDALLAEVNADLQKPIYDPNKDSAFGPQADDIPSVKPADVPKDAIDENQDK